MMRHGRSNSAALGVPWVGLALCVASAAQAQVVYKPTPRVVAYQRDLRFNEIGKEHGLPEAHVSAVVQDSAGYLWFGGDNTLSVYDGRIFRKIEASESPDPSKPSSTFVTALAADTSGGVWIGTGDAGVNFFDPSTGQFRRFLAEANDLKTIPSMGVSSLHIGTEGVWVGTTGGLALIDRQTFEVTRWLGEDEGVFSPVTALAELDDQRLWIGTAEDGAFLLDPNTNELAAYSPSEAKQAISGWEVATILVARSGEVWLGTEDGGVSVLSPEGTAFRAIQTTDDRLPSSHVSALLQDSLGGIWVGTTQSGVSRLDPDTGELITVGYDPGQAGGLPQSVVQMLYEDRGGVIWVGLGQGLAYLATWSLGHEQYSSFGDVCGYVHDGNGVLWLASPTTGLLRVAENQRTAVAYDFPPLPGASVGERSIETWIHHLDIDQDGNLWMASRHRGVLQFRPKDETFVHYYAGFDDQNAVPSNEVLALHINREGAIWIGTWGEGLAFYDGSQDVFVPVSQLELPSQFVSDVLEDASGRALWVGTADGLARVNFGELKVEQFRHSAAEPTSLSKNAVSALLQDPDGTLWVGTLGGGLNAFDPQSKSFTHYSTAEGLSSGVVYGLVGRYSEELWLSTNEGITRFSRTERTGTSIDWPRGSEFTQGSYYQAANGDVFFGGKIDKSQSFVHFSPERIAKYPYVPPVVIRNVFVHDEDAREKEEFIARERNLRVPYDAAFTVEFAALSFAFSNRNQHEYRLEGLNDIWVSAGLGRATFSRLPPGDYVLRTRGSNFHGVWNEDGQSFRISVGPPPWATWWAYTIYGILIVMALTAAWYYQRQRLESLRRGRRLDAVERDLELTGAVQNWFIANTADPDAGFVKLKAIYKPADHASGDWWMQEGEPGQEQIVLVADVTGHGAGAAMVTIAAAAAFRASKLHGSSIAERIGYLNQEILQAGAGHYYMTMTCLRFESDGTYEMLSAGGLPILHLKGKRARAIVCAGTALGSQDFVLGRTSGKLAKGERLLLLTDGVPEVEDSNGRQFGMRRTAKLFVETHDQPLEEAGNSILATVAELQGNAPQGDDWTFIVIEYTGDCAPS